MRCLGSFQEFIQFQANGMGALWRWCRAHVFEWEAELLFVIHVAPSRFSSRIDRGYDRRQAGQKIQLWKTQADLTRLAVRLFAFGAAEVGWTSAS